MSETAPSDAFDWARFEQDRLAGSEPVDYRAELDRCATWLRGVPEPVLAAGRTNPIVHKLLMVHAHDTRRPRRPLTECLAEIVGALATANASLIDQMMDIQAGRPLQITVPAGEPIQTREP